MDTRVSVRRRVSLFVAACLLSQTGCGSGFNESLYLAASATGQTFLDVFLAGFANTLADTLDQDGAPVSGADTGGADTPPSEGPPTEETAGDPNAGEGVYTSNGCTACHCADATGGCALDAPSVVDEETTALDDRLRGNATHSGGKVDLTNQDIADLQAYLASLAGGG